MKLLKTMGLVIASQPLGEKDRLLKIYSREKGKLSAVAPGARKIKSKLAAGVDYFTCASFLLHEGRSLYTVTQLEIESVFRRISANIRDYTCGIYICELLDRLTEEKEANWEIFKLTLDCWRCLDAGMGDRDILVRYFELKLLSLLGYRPHFKNCLFCGSSRGPFYWSADSGGVFCESCRPAGAVFPFSGGAHALAYRLLELPCADKVVNLRASEAQKKELQRFTAHFLLQWTGGGPFKGLSFLEKINLQGEDKKTPNASE